MKGLKARKRLAQGNALGSRPHKSSKPCKGDRNEPYSFSSSAIPAASFLSIAISTACFAFSKSPCASRRAARAAVICCFTFLIPVHSIFKVWRDIFRDEKIPESHLFTLEKKPQRCYDYVGERVFAIDFDEKTVRVARCLNLIAGDGQTNVLHLNTLDYERWDETTKSKEWRIHDSVVRGEIDNRVKGRVRGRIWLDGLPDPVVLKLAGNACPDLAGCLLQFKNPLQINPMRTDARMNPMQRGQIGDLTASRKVRVFDIPVEEAYLDV